MLAYSGVSDCMTFLYCRRCLGHCDVLGCDLLHLVKLKSHEAILFYLVVFVIFVF